MSDLISNITNYVNTQRAHLFEVTSSAYNCTATNVSGYLGRQTENCSRIAELLPEELATYHPISDTDSTELGIRIAAVAAQVFTSAPMVASWFTLGILHTPLSFYTLTVLGLALADDLMKLAPSGGVQETFFISKAVNFASFIQSFFKKN